MSKNTENLAMMDNYFENLKKYKKKFGDKIFLIWQCGSFFEIYGVKRNNITDHYLLEYSRILDCQIAKRGKYKDEPLEMAGFTVHKPLQKYVPKLLDEGYTVIVWEEYAEKIVKKKK